MTGRVPAGSGRSLFSDPLAVEVADADAVLLAAEPLAVAVPEAETEAETELSTSLPLAETLAVAEALPLSESVEVEIASMLKLAVSVMVLLSDVTVLEGSTDVVFCEKSAEEVEDGVNEGSVNLARQAAGAVGMMNVIDGEGVAVAEAEAVKLLESSVAVNETSVSFVEAVGVADTLKRVTLLLRSVGSALDATEVGVSVAVADIESLELVTEGSVVDVGIVERSLLMSVAEATTPRVVDEGTSPSRDVVSKVTSRL